MTVTIRLKDDLEKRYTDLASATGRSKSYYIREALEDAIERLEFEYGVLRTLEEVRSGKQETYTADEVLAMLGDSNVER